MDNGTLVLVQWVDIVGDDNWLTIEDGQSINTHPFVSVGWLLRKDKSTLVITSCYSPADDTVGGVTSIPMGAVLDVKPLKSHRMPKSPCFCKRSPKK